MRPVQTPRFAATEAFESWVADPVHPEQVGMIRCCGRTVIMRNGSIICDQCDTVVETGLDGWRIVRHNGRSV